MGCTSIGTILLPKNRQGFAGAMIVSDEQQLLLNVVRIQFEDRPVFMNVDTITTSNNLSSSLGANFSITSSPNRSFTDSERPSFTQSFSLSRSASLTPNVSYSDSPTVSYSPLQGERFMRHIMKPITMQDVYLLFSSEWDAERVFRILFERVGDMYNMSKFSDTELGNTEEPCGKDKRFLELAKYLTYLESKHMIYFSTSNINRVKLPPGMTREQFDKDENNG